MGYQACAMMALLGRAPLAPLGRGPLALFSLCNGGTTILGLRDGGTIRPMCNDSTIRPCTVSTRLALLGRAPLALLGLCNGSAIRPCTVSATTFACFTFLLRFVRVRVH